MDQRAFVLGLFLATSCATMESTNGVDGGRPSGAGGGSNGLPAKSGTLTLAQSTAQVGLTVVTASVASAVFVTSTGVPVGTAPNCSQRSSGVCLLTVCSSNDAGIFNQDAGAFSYQNAGTISFSGTIADGGLQLPVANGGYAFYSSSEKLWASGALIKASAPGGVVPAFSSPALEVPNNIALTAPICASSNCGAISRTMDLATTWTGGGAGFVTFTVIGVAGAVSSSLSCTYDARGGVGVVPASLMAELPAGSGFVSFTPSNKTNFQAGDYAVTFTAAATTVSGIVVIK
jgi:hypothetical protein